MINTDVLSTEEIEAVVDAAEVKAHEILAIFNEGIGPVVAMSALMLSMEAVINAIPQSENTNLIIDGLLFWADTLKDNIHPHSLH